MITQPPVNKVIAKEVEASDEKYTVDGVSGIPKAYVQDLMSFQLQARLT
jgi:hypothetical protein